MSAQARLWARLGVAICHLDTSLADSEDLPRGWLGTVDQNHLAFPGEP
jgi:hypothetical protein